MLHILVICRHVRYSKWKLHLDFSLSPSVQELRAVIECGEGWYFAAARKHYAKSTFLGTRQSPWAVKPGLGLIDCPVPPSSMIRYEAVRG